MDLQLKYRPKDLRTFVGHKSVVKTIGEDHKNGQLKHNILLIGDSGTGKTTLAYIICRHLLKVHESLIKEINAADARGIDDVRDLLKDVGSRPLIGENKAFIVDEAHQLTKDAQQALLKPLENEKNSHVYWIFCTTNPNSIIATIKNRCTQYTLSALTNNDIVEVIRPILKEESINLPEEVLKIIVSRAKGIPREAVKLLDQLRNIKEKEEIDKILKEYGTNVDEFDRLHQFLKKPWSEVGPRLKDLFEKKHPESVRIGALAYYGVILTDSNNKEFSKQAANIMEVLKEPILYKPEIPYGKLMIYKIHKIINGE